MLTICLRQVASQCSTEPRPQGAEFGQIQFRSILNRRTSVICYNQQSLFTQKWSSDTHRVSLVQCAATQSMEGFQFEHR